MAFIKGFVKSDRQFSRIFDYLGAILPAVTICAVAAFLIREIMDADSWWQVAIGRDILERFAVPVKDHFSAAAMGRDYHDSHWLFQVVAAIADRLAGMTGVGAVTVALWGVTFHLCYRAIRRWAPLPAGCILIFVVAMASAYRFTPRPDIVTCLMIALFYLRLQEGKYRSFADLALLGIAQALWANSHGLFVIGPFMAGCYWIAEALRRGRGDAAELWAATRLLSVVSIATLITPFGFAGWRYALLLATEAGPSAPMLFKTIVELSPTFGAVSMSTPEFWFFLPLLVMFGVTSILLIRGRRLTLSRFLIVAGLCVAALAGRRNIPLFALAAAPLLAENLGALFPQWKLLRFIPALAALCMLLSAWLPLSGKYYVTLNLPVRFGLGATPSIFPRGLPDYLRKTRFEGQIYNSNYLGGFCLYHGFRPLMDGRWEVYDPQILTDILSAPGNRQLWDRVVARYDIRGVALLHKSDEAVLLLPQLRNDPRWRLVYFDHASSFWMRTDSPRLPPPADLSLSVSLLKGPMRIENYLMLGSFFSGLDRPDLGLRFMERALALGERMEEVLEQLGKAQMDTGRTVEAERTYQRLLQENPDNTAALNELAFLAYWRGDLKTAESYLHRALALNPDNPDFRANYERVRKAGAPGK